MNRNAMDVRLVERICRGEREAAEFLVAWARYCHEIDDIVDGDRPGAEAILETFALAAVLYSMPFYLKHLAELRGVVLAVTETYAQTVRWEPLSGSAIPGRPLGEPDRMGIGGSKWRAQWADMHRHCSNQMVQAVCLIVGGYEHTRAVMEELRVMAWHEHHDREGKVI